MPQSDASHIALATDLYELTMAAMYLARGMNETATFSLFVRDLPPGRSYLVAAGLQEALRRLDTLAFDGEAAAYLESTGRFSAEHIARLLATRFTGDVWAVPEGRVVFAGEPLLEVQAPILQAQLVETVLLNAMYYPSLVATKAARCVSAAPRKTLVDFGMRRMPSIDASVAAARACYLAGFAATSNVLAGHELGIPVSGTVAHSLVEVFPSERQAFRAYADTATGGVTLLVDTYETLRGVARAIQVAHDLARDGRRVEAIRLDSGDLADLARRARGMLDDADLAHVRIFASGGLDEYELSRLEAARAPIDGYGIGTRLGMSADAPVLDMAYKIVAYADRPCLKLSEGKATVVGPKQVWRRNSEGGQFVEDVIAARDEPPPGPNWEPLLEWVVRNGQVGRLPTLTDSRSRHAQEMRRMPPGLLDLHSARAYPVRISPELGERQRRAVASVRGREGRDEASSNRYGADTALVVVDLQNDFADPRGRLYVRGGETIVDVANREIRAALSSGSPVFYTQDWHPEHTPHFARDGGVWPVHCVRNTWGAEFAPQVIIQGEVVRKGVEGEDGYSAFAMRAADRPEVIKRTDLEKLLRSRNIRRVIVIGLATDYCVKETAMDALRLGFDVTVPRDATRAVEMNSGDGERSLAELEKAGAHVL